MKQLAIIIPAYKATFLDAALASIAAQTCQDFTLYIGDDCSPYDLRSIVDRYRDKIDLVYKRFDNNLGGKDLVAQWERCIDMSHDEPWLWLFSDDDVMESRCVEEFYKAQKGHPQERLFHFNISQIDAEGKVIRKVKRYPQHLSAYEYLDGHQHQGLLSFVVEFIFHRQLHSQCGGFENFDLAWGADLITWVKFADAAGGMFTIDTAEVHWRLGGENISSDRTLAMLMRKLRNEMAYTCWIKQFLVSHGMKFSYRWYRTPYGQIWRNRRLLSVGNGSTLAKEYGRMTKLNAQTFAFLIFWHIVKAVRL